MFDLFTLSARDAAMLGSGAIAIATSLVGVAVVHKVKPALVAWLAKEKPTILALEDKMRSAFGMASRAIADVEAKAKAGDAAIIARIVALEVTVFGKSKTIDKP